MAAAVEAVSGLLLLELSEVLALEAGSAAGLLSESDLVDSSAPFLLPFSVGGLGRP